MARLSSASIGETKKAEGGIKVEPLEEDTLAEARVNAGMITSLDPADIPNGALQKCKNARVRFDRTSRRPGGIILGPDKPTNESILGLSYFKQNNKAEYFFRATKSSIYKRDTSVWTNVPADITPLGGGDTDFFQFASAFNRHFFTNNGVNPIQEVDLSVPKYKILNVSEATVKTNFRFLTSFYNRIVGANLQGGSPDPTMVGWSADAGFTGVGLEEWNPAVNETAGRAPLIDTPGDVADFITNIFGFATFVLVLREQSIWKGTKKPIATDPIYFYPAFPGIGCDCPYSAVVGIGKLMWLDYRTKSVWSYIPDQAPQPIARNVEKDILKAVDDKEKIFGSYRGDDNEYTIAIPLAGSGYTRLWTLNERTNAWAYDEMEGVTRVIDSPYVRSSLPINDLPGKINELVGTINGLTPTQVSVYTRMYGRTDGEIVLEDINTYRDPPIVTSKSVSSGSYETDLVSKDFENKDLDTIFSKLLFKIKPYAPGSIQLQYSKDNKPFKVAKSKTFVAADISKSILFKFTKQINCRRLTWRLVATDGYWDLEEYEIKIYPAGPARK